jgi:AcrR family transcriptional regulator
MQMHCYSSLMPRQVDHDTRRRLIAEALWRVASRYGLDAVSLRHVAAEAGVSMGMVQHYFTTKDDMLRFALETIGERAAQRIGQRVAALPHGSDPHALLRTVLVEMLPLDEPRHLEAHVGFAFLARAAVQQGIAERLREQHSQLRDFVAGQIRAAQQAGQAAAELDPDYEAVVLLSLMEGLTAHTLAGHHSPHTALATFDRHLGQLFDTGDLFAPASTV